MAFDYATAFKRIISKANLLTERYKILLEKKEAAEAEVADLKKQLAKKDKELAQLRNEAEYLRIAATVSPSREQVEQTRAMISDLVREIDRCIIDLSE